MGLFQFEKKLEGLVEGTFAKMFKSGLQPVEIGRKLTREMDLKRQVAPNGVIVPNVYVITLSPDDAQRFNSFQSALIRDLVETVRNHARQERYIFVGTVRIDMDVDEELAMSRFYIDSEVLANKDGLPGASLVGPDGTRYIVGNAPLVLGRLPECDIVISDTKASRRHAEFHRAGNDVVVLDLGSTNGTRVNGALVTRQRLNDGDEVTIGSTSFYFQVI